MKHAIYLLFLLPLVALAQPSKVTALYAFHGTTWEWTDGAKTFQVKLFDFSYVINEPLDGLTFFLSYKMTDVSGNILYKTRPALLRYKGNLPFGGILGASDSPTPNLYGQIDDYSNSNYEYSIPGMLEIVYIPCNGLACPPQISWKISKPKEIVKDPDSPDDYNLPKDIVLTKVN
jgi:hypothetical protein